MAANGVVKALWRNSACLVLGSGPIQYLPKPLVSSASDLRCYIEDSGNGNPSADSQFLFVKRSFKSGFMANVHVFPGGVVDEADYSTSWRDLFSYYAKRKRQDVFQVFNSRSGLPIYKTPSSVIGIPGEVALRICAIRETFEETGVLLLRGADQLQSVAESVPGTVPPSVKMLPEDQLSHWRRLVHSDARNFIAMCRELECVPDVYSLVEWSNWLTPSNYARRFDTVFFFCCTDAKPDATFDSLEVSQAEWLNLIKSMELLKEEKLMFSPPQMAQIYLLLALGALPCIHCYALQNAALGHVRRNVSVRIKTKDEGVLSLTDNDDLFPIEATPYKPEKVSFHHCQSVALKDVQLKVVLDNVFYEYECTSHTADQLAEMSTAKSRWQFGPQENWYNIKVCDNVLARDVKVYLERYNTLKWTIESKL